MVQRPWNYPDHTWLRCHQAVHASYVTVRETAPTAAPQGLVCTPPVRLGRNEGHRPSGPESFHVLSGRLRFSRRPRPPPLLQKPALKNRNPPHPETAGFAQEARDEAHGRSMPRINGKLRVPVMDGTSGYRLHARKFPYSKQKPHPFVTCPALSPFYFHRKNP